MSQKRMLRHRKVGYLDQCFTASRLKDWNPSSSALDAFGAMTQSVSCGNRVLSTSPPPPAPTLAAPTD